jgi:glutamate synthase domain-containing protein 1
MTKMKNFHEISDQIKTLKAASDILKERYDSSEFHKKKEKFPQSAVPSSPKDEEIYKLLTVIQQLDKYIKELQNEQFKVLKQED